MLLSTGVAERPVESHPVSTPRNGPPQHRQIPNWPGRTAGPPKLLAQATRSSSTGIRAASPSRPRAPDRDAAISRSEGDGAHEWSHLVVIWEKAEWRQPGRRSAADYPRPRSALRVQKATPCAWCGPRGAALAETQPVLRGAREHTTHLPTAAPSVATGIG